MARKLITYKAPFANTWDVTRQALEEMGFSVESKKHDATSGKITAKRAGGKTISIELKYRSPEETETTIRVGFYGDEYESNVIKDKIGEVLFK